MAMRRTLLSKLLVFYENVCRNIFRNEGAFPERCLLVLIFFCYCVPLQTIHAQTRDHNGKEFFFAFLPNPIEPLTLQLSIHAKTETKVVVEYPVGVPLSDSIAVLPGEVRIIDIPQEAGALSSWPGHTFGQSDKNSIRVSATEAIVCYLISRNDASSDGGLAIPTNALHKNYVIMSYDIGDQAVGDAGIFVVVAANDSTEVTITPVKGLEGGFAAGKPITLLLKRGEGFLAESEFGFFGADSTLAGSFIKATKPVSVINGNKCSRVPLGNPSCDHLFEIAQPIQTWGKHVLVTALGDESIRPSGAVYRILTSAPNTVVHLDGQLLGTIKENQFLDTDTLRGAHLFTADKPIFVTQFMTSKVTANSVSADPGMVNMIPTEQFANSYTFSIPSSAQSLPLFENNRMTVIVKNEDIGTFTHNGTIVSVQEFTAIVNTGFSAATIEIQQEVFHHTESGSGHSAIVWGFSNDNSYMYPAGARLEIINPLDMEPPEISIAYREDSPDTVFGLAFDSKTGGMGERDSLLYDGEASGIRSIFLVDSSNVKLGSLDFTPGDASGAFTLVLVEPTLPGKATVIVADQSENQASREVFIPACDMQITEPVDHFVTPERQISMKALTTFKTLDGDGPASYDKLDTVFVNGVALAGSLIASTDSSLSATVPLAIGKNMLIAKRLYRHKDHDADPARPITSCADTVSVTRAGSLSCEDLTIIAPEDSATIRSDSVAISFVNRVSSGDPLIIRYLSLVNSTTRDTIASSDTLFSAQYSDTTDTVLFLAIGWNRIFVASSLRDRFDQLSVCADTIDIYRSEPFVCQVGIDNPGDGDSITVGRTTVKASFSATGGVQPYADTTCYVIIDEDSFRVVANTGGSFETEVEISEGTNAITAVCILRDAQGFQTTCDSTITVTGLQEFLCSVDISTPPNDSIVTADSVVVLATTQATGGAWPYADTTCFIIVNGDSIEVLDKQNGVFSAKIPLLFGINTIEAMSIFTDAIGQKTTCGSIIEVTRPEPLVCAATILSPADGAVFITDSVDVVAIAKVNGGLPPISDSCTVNGLHVPVQNDTISIRLPLTIGANPIDITCIFEDSAGQKTSCEAGVSVVREDGLSCAITILFPADGATITADSVLVQAIAKVAGGVPPVADSCTVNGLRVPVTNDTIAVKLPLEVGANRIELFCSFTDSLGQQTTCETTVTVTRPSVLSCTLAILSPADGEVLSRDSTLVTAITAVRGGVRPTLSRSEINGKIASVSGDTLRSFVPLNPGANTIEAFCVYTDVDGDSVVCLQTIQVFKDTLTCEVTIISPLDSAFVCGDRVSVIAVLQLAGGITLVQKECTINGVEATVANDTLTAMVALDAGTTMIVASCTFTDAGGRTFSCNDTVGVLRDTIPPECDFKPENGDIVGTFTDTGSGIAAIETVDIENGRLIVEPFQPGDKVVNFRIQRIRSYKSLRFNIDVFDVCGNRFLCDPVFLSLEANSGSRRYEMSFPSVDRYLYLTNHGLQEIRIDLNGKKFLFEAGTSHERLQNNKYRIPLEGTIAFDLKPSLQETGNTMIVEIEGPSGSSAELLILDVSTGVDYLLEYEQDLPITFRLLQNYPNPFNPKTSIPIDVPANWSHPVTLKIFNSTGRLIKTVLEGYIPAGRKTISWDGTDASGAPVASGLYFYRVASGDVVSMRKLILAR